ncbi:MAG: hypothetical protein EBS05_08260 [Proteobacteria bacterium]|nr:hypothetical protein [Pseudomonadota bacterium]
MHLMKTLRPLLILLFAVNCLHTAQAQTDPPFEGLRFKDFNATFTRDYFTPLGLTNGTYFYLAFQLTCANVIEGGTNAYRHITLNGYWDPQTGGAATSPLPWR